LGITMVQIGVINSVFYAIGGILSLPSGLLSDIFGRKRLTIYGTVLLLLGMIALYFCRTYFHFAVVYFLLGAGMAAFGPTTMSWVAEFAPFSHLGRAYGWYTTALFCGLGMGPAAGGVLGEWVGMRPVFLISALIVAINLWAIWRFLPSDAGAQGRGKNQGQWRSGLGKILTNRPLIGCWLVTLGAFITAGSFFSFMPLLADHRGLDLGQIGVVFLVQSSTNALSRIPFGIFSDRIGHRKYQALVGNIMIMASTAAFAPAGTFYHFLFAGVALGLSHAVGFTSIGALIAETVEPRYRGLAMGGYNACIFFGLMAGSVGLGPLIEAVGFGMGFFLISLVNTPFVIFFAWSMKGYFGEDLGKDREVLSISP
jgi:MFS family permease